MTTHPDDIDVALRKAVTHIRDQAPEAPSFESLASGATPPRRTRPTGRLVAAAAVAAIVIGIAVATLGGDGTDDVRAGQAETTPAPTVAEPSPTAAPTPTAANALGVGAALEGAADLAAIDVDSGPPVFEAGGGPLDVARAYLADRMGPQSLESLQIETETLVDGEVAVVRWSSEVDSADEVRLAGLILLRMSADTGVVLGSAIDGVQTSAIFGGSLVAGTATTTTGQSMFVDILDPSGTPVPGSPRPEGASPESPFLFGTAAGAQPPGGDRLAFGVPASADYVIVRTSLVGGLILGVAEHVLENPIDPDEWTCGPELPVRIAYLSAGPVSFVAGDGTPGQLVTVASTAEGLQIRTVWPASPRAEYGLNTGQSSDDGATIDRLGVSTDEFGRAEIIVDDGTDRGITPLVFDAVEPATVADGCELIEVVIERDGATIARGGWDVTADSDAFPLVTLAPYVSDVRTDADSPPPPIGCAAPPGAGDIPNVEGDSSSGPSATPVGALAAFLDTEAAETFFKAGYVELQISDTTYIYGAPLEGGGPDEWVTLITVEQSEAGWAAMTYVASGC